MARRGVWARRVRTALHRLAGAARWGLPLVVGAWVTWVSVTRGAEVLAGLLAGLVAGGAVRVLLVGGGRR